MMSKNYIGFEVDGNSQKQHLTAKFLGEQTMVVVEFKELLSPFHKLRFRVSSIRTVMFGPKNNIPVVVVGGLLLRDILYSIDIITHKVGIKTAINYPLTPHITLKGHEPKEYYTLSRLYLKQDGKRYYA